MVYESMYEVHVSGHACQEELKLIQALTKPKYFIPVHGEQKHLRKHAGVAVSMGMPPENIFIGDVGSVVEINEDYMKQLPDVQAGAVMVDGSVWATSAALCCVTESTLRRTVSSLRCARLRQAPAELFPVRISYPADLCMCARARR